MVLYLTRYKYRIDTFTFIRRRSYLKYLCHVVIRIIHWRSTWRLLSNSGKSLRQLRIRQGSVDSETPMVLILLLVSFSVQKEMVSLKDCISLWLYWVVYWDGVQMWKIRHNWKYWSSRIDLEYIFKERLRSGEYILGSAADYCEKLIGLESLMFFYIPIISAAFLSEWWDIRRATMEEGWPYPLQLHLLPYKAFILALLVIPISLLIYEIFTAALRTSFPHVRGPRWALAVITVILHCMNLWLSVSTVDIFVITRRVLYDIQ